MSADWIPAPDNNPDLIPDGCEVRIVIYGIRRTTTEPMIVVRDDMVIGDGEEETTTAHVEHTGREVYYREVTR